ncbi:hypothetical protein PG984_016543 [Apiospora sp. TS-2023a]
MTFIQELLAPRKLVFYDRNWKHIGLKEDLFELITDATGISKQHLQDFRSASLAQKISWLARRNTKYLEDRAYCMLGIFGIFLDARYGQGEHEFLRLQREIINGWTKGSFDESLFAWTTDKIKTSGILAPDPGCFRDAGDIVYKPKLAKPRISRSTFGQTLPTDYRVDPSNNFDFVLPLSSPIVLLNLWSAIQYGYKRTLSSHQVRLNAWAERPNGTTGAVQIKLQKQQDGTWCRVHCNERHVTRRTQLHRSRWLAMVNSITLRVTHNIKYEY